jgi:predicted DNA-binding protein with PD1-like motif
MSFLARFTRVLLTLVVGSTGMVSAAGAQEAKVTYLSPAESGQKRGSAPGMKVKLISTGEGPKQYAVIFSAGDEAYSGLLDFAEKCHVTSAHFTAIGALSRVVLGWFDPQKKMYRQNPIDEQVEVATMMGDFALYQGKPSLHSHIVVGRRDGTANGGHLIEAIVSPTLEVFVTVDPVPLGKKYDPSSHLTLIDPDSQ